MTEKLDQALGIINESGRMDTLTGAAMTGKKAIQVITSDLPASPERKEIIKDTGSGMQDLLDEHRKAKSDIDANSISVLSELDRFMASQPTLDEMVTAAKEELGIK